MRPHLDRNERVYAFVRDKIAPFVDDWEREGGYPASLYRAAGEAHILALGHENWRQDPAGVMRAPYAEKMAYLRHLNSAGSQAVAVALSAHLVSLKILLDGDRRLFDGIAPKVLSGQGIVNIAITEPQAGTDLRNTQCIVEDQGRGRTVITGRKAFVSHGPRASWIIATAKIEDLAGQPIGLFLVPLGAQTRVETIEMSGWRALPVGHVEMERAEAIPIGAPGKPAMSLLQEALSIERLNLSVLAVQSAEMALQQAADYARARASGAGALVQRQAISQKLAEMKRQTEVASVFIDYVAAKPDPWLSADLAIAKNTATKCLEFVARETVQITGARGCVEDSRPARMYRDSRILPVGGGTEEIMNEIIARSF